ncbi:hypothetical protein SCATT_18040 [Streptantibioticus cattleyicolor NRRL 8057 = DSM 46488]|uniref:Uncharacterized protein n=1 Tax=Streptantibioticus cattleyicolor (strain ATCC 35852 / DSM 46488 / JCM 4925 / NBRC 14057 / NRRL 8057) TaxID=1003195 RepID=G8WQB5_STREN|nr:hypothetical protein SCATT_18040 [Streptantibioticus cattleyicolor NRRL 8057 = DSM 46488]
MRGEQAADGPEAEIEVASREAARCPRFRYPLCGRGLLRPGIRV